jgi:HAE1 family hydrophobic/amphiphilic exporter-1
MATTLAIIVIFLPVAFMKGIIGRFFLQFALTVVFSVAVSLIVSFTMTPMLASLYLTQRHRSKNSPEPPATGRFAGWKTKLAWFRRAGDVLETGYRKTETLYRSLLELAVNHRGLVLLLALGLFVFSLFITRFIGKEFVPPEDQGQFLVRMEAPFDYSVDRADEMFRQAEDMISKLSEVRSVFYIQGMGAGGVGEVNKAVAFVTLHPKADRKRSQEQIKAEIRRNMRTVPGLKGTAEDVSLIGGGIRNVPILYAIRGTSLADLQTYTRQITSEFSKVPGIVDVDTSIEAGKPEVKVFIDRDKAADLGVSVGSIAEAVNILVSGEVDITKYKDEERGRRFDVRVRLNPEDRSNPSDLGNIYVRGRDGRLVELASVASFQEGGGPSTIQRVDRQRATIVYAGLEKKPLAEAMTELNAISSKVLPSDYSAKYKGPAETMGNLPLLDLRADPRDHHGLHDLAAQFESFIHPFTVLLSMPLSFIGAFGALLLTGNTISIYSLIGIILLMGLVKKNAILLVDYTKPLSGARHVQEGGDPPGRACAAPADPHDHLRNGLRHDPRSTGGRGRCGDPCTHGHHRHRRAPDIAFPDAGGGSRRL